MKDITITLTGRERAYLLKLLRNQLTDIADVLINKLLRRR
jgi:hypothetical protein